MMELSGLVVCGGKSSRMGTDKCLLEYHGIPQWQHIYNLLQLFCKQILISCNSSQTYFFRENVECIVDDDKYIGIGPMAALLSAEERFPQSAFLFIGCDYPFVKQAELQLLVDARSEDKNAVAYFNESINSYEPLIALYEEKSLELLKRNFQNKKYSLRYFLEEVRATKVYPLNDASIISVNTFEEYKEVKKVF